MDRPFLSDVASVVIEESKGAYPELAERAENIKKVIRIEEEKFEETIDQGLVILSKSDSGVSAALGYSMESGIPYDLGLIKNKYIGRTFIQPEQGQRESGVKIKLNALKEAVNGKRVVMIDDSIVRGTTSKRLVQILRDAGAKEVHMRISSPPYMYPCFFGVDTSSRSQLIAAECSVEEIRKMTGADSLGYLSLEGLLKTPVGAKCGFCTGCFTGKYPMEVPKDASKYSCG